MNNDKLNILTCIIPVTLENKDKVTVLPDFPHDVKPGDVVEYNYSVRWETNIELTLMSDAEYKALLGAISACPTTVDNDNLVQVKANMEETKEQMRILTDRLDALIKVI